MRARGFMAWAEDYIASHPGLTAQEIASWCLILGVVTSEAQNPEASLVATLHKHHSDEGRNIVRRRESGVYRFYPVDSQIEESQPAPDTTATDKITPDQLHKLVAVADQLVEIGKFKKQADALVWLIQK